MGNCDKLNSPLSSSEESNPLIVMCRPVTQSVAIIYTAAYSHVHECNGSFYVIHTYKLCMTRSSDITDWHNLVIVILYNHVL